MRSRALTLIPLAGFGGFLHAEEAGSTVSETLFEHILDGEELYLFPYLPPLRLPFGMTVHLLMVFLAFGLLVWAFLRSFRKPNLRPKGLAMVLEMAVLFIRNDIVYPIMGEKRGERWLSFFITLFLFVLVLNFLGLIPAFKAATGNISVSTALALLILVMIFLVGILRLGLGKFFKNFFPEGSPFAIGLFVALLEFMGTLIKGLVLSLRLFANMFAGHLAILSFLVLMFVLNPAFGLISVPFAIFTYALEVLVALIQAFVFTLLSCIFITMASSSHEGSHEK